MRDKFTITGFFYYINNHKFRTYLDIKHKQTTQKTPDLMVVMMNPGDSYPLNGKYNTLTEAKPDKTQDQIMKVMLNTSFKYARVLNLSDLIEPKSNNLYTFLASKEAIDIPHSIFAPERANELNNLFVKNVPVICGWGVNSNLIPLATQTLNSIKNEKIVGINKSGITTAYYHPLPLGDIKKQIKWVKDITNQLI